MTDDPGVSEMCLALVTYCRDTRTTQDDANASEVRITVKGSRWLAEAGA